MCTHLRRLSLRNCAIDDECFILICDRLFSAKHLSKLDFKENRITDIGIDLGLTKLLLSVMPPPLSDLNFESNQITSEGSRNLF